jgi:hypothetical protein
MSNNEDPFPVLRDSEILAVKHLPFRIIPHLIQRGEDDSERFSRVAREEPFDVLKEQYPRSLDLSNPDDFKEEFATRVRKPPSFSRKGMGLARKSRAKHIKIWEGVRVELSSVAWLVVLVEVAVVDRDGVLVDFAVTNATKFLLWPPFAPFRL